MKKQKILIFILLPLILFLIVFRTSIKNNFVHFLEHKTKVNELATTEYVNNILNQTGNYNSQVKTALFEGKQIPLPEILAQLPLDESVLGLQAYAASGEKWIEIDLDNQKLYAHEGDTIVYEFPISSGVPWLPTVTGEFRIWSKLRYTRMSGGCDVGDCYDLPNVPYTQYFYKGYALHGAYWHNDFGRPRSHGCVNLRIPDAEKLYYWTSPPVTSDVTYPTNDNPGTRVVIHGKARL